MRVGKLWCVYILLLVGILCVGSVCAASSLDWSRVVDPSSVVGGDESVQVALNVIFGGDGFMDFDQCDRRCNQVLGGTYPGGVLTGVRLSQHSCNCSVDGAPAPSGVVPFNTPFYPPPFPLNATCGADGVNYPTQEAACAAGTYPLHGGYCGKCSNLHDINVYNVTRNNMTDIASRCASKYVLGGKQAAAQCFLDVAGLTDSCNECWVENMGCDAAQCLMICAIDRALHLNNTNPDGSLNDCLMCDEAYCGLPFIQCAGANRRRCGIHSDIDRANDQIWKRYAC